jgi:hypothetical protein
MMNNHRAAERRERERENVILYNTSVLAVPPWFDNGLS